MHVTCDTAMCDYQESVTTGQSDTEATQSDYVLLCLAGDTKPLN